VKYFTVLFCSKISSCKIIWNECLHLVTSTCCHCIYSVVICFGKLVKLNLVKWLFELVSHTISITAFLKKKCINVLVLDGIIFFIEASMRLCFTLVLKTGMCDNTGMFSSLLSSAYIVSRPFLLLTSPCQWLGCGCTRRWEGTLLGQLIPADKWDIPHHMMSPCSAIKSWEKKKEGEGGHSK